MEELKQVIIEDIQKAKTFSELIKFLEGHKLQAEIVRDLL